jgi:hypothetical protein
MAAAGDVDRQVETWSGEIVELLRRHGGGNKRIAIGKIEPLGLRRWNRPGMSMSRPSLPRRPAPSSRTRSR